MYRVINYWKTCKEGKLSILLFYCIEPFFLPLQHDFYGFKKMKVFHGSNIVIEQPKITNRFKTLDFGEGFYTTENESQARDFALKVCKRRSPALDPIVNCYEFNEDLNKFSVLKFDSPNEKWLDFVVERRKGISLSQKYDLIIGPVANDDVFGTIILYEAGQLDKESAIKNFKVKKLYNQAVFCNELILSRLIFIKSYKV